MRPHAKTKLTVGVVDPDRDCYDRLVSSIAASTATFRFYATGQEVLRRNGTDDVAFWLLGVELPDMRGLDLLDMVRERLDGAAICMVGDDYRIEDEVAAYRAGATLYTCKPIEASWLRECLFRRRRVACGEVVRLNRPTSAARSPPARRRA
jgi:DNA-binding response OmpR family regulator